MFTTAGATSLEILLNTVESWTGEGRSKAWASGAFACRWAARTPREINVPIKIPIASVNKTASVEITLRRCMVCKKSLIFLPPPNHLETALGKQASQICQDYTTEKHSTWSSSSALISDRCG